ncbi:hypothetical protein CLSAP_35260 [Clostridium saccharoperbutylacetonicum]|nr:hypothetical protein CLSAP_35260 [Clostridium saccharoperbutylacetonicum]NSB32078.1 hypothetical protein [Clostridium saccharoperbutylacetonicum]
MEAWNCSKKPNDCPYRFDYRRCIKLNCPYPNEYALKEASLFYGYSFSIYIR